MSRWRRLVLAVLAAGCSGPPPVAPAAADAVPAQLARCRAVFPRPDFRAVHAITATMPGDRPGAFLGVTATREDGQAFRSELLSPEGMMLVNLEWSATGVVVHRALPPLDAAGFAEGMAADIRLLLLPPAGEPIAVGAYGDGRAACRWRRDDGGLLDVVVGAAGDWELHAWDTSGEPVREVRATGVRADGFAGRLELSAPGERGYSLVLELLEVEPAGP